MTDHAAQQRDALRARIEAAERRNAERSLADQARDAAGAAADYTRAHPLTVIGGAVVLGLAIGLLTRPGRRVAGKALHSAGEAISDAASTASSGVKRVTARSGSRLGEMIGEAVLGYVMATIEDLIETARTGQARAEDLGEATGAAADSTRDLVRKTADLAAGVVRDIRRKAEG